MQSQALLNARNPGLLPSLKLNNAWAGQDPTTWKPEAVYANSISDLMNSMWSQPNVRDVLVAVPVKFWDRGDNFCPYGDGQMNARLHFDEAWRNKTLPMRAALVHFTGGQSNVYISFSPDLKLSASSLDVYYAVMNSTPKSFKIPAQTNSAGELTALWQDIPSELGWNQSGLSDDIRAQNSGNITTILVRPSTGFNDWLPLSFAHPWALASQMEASVLASRRNFSAASGVPAPNSLIDPLAVAQRDQNDDIPFDKLLSSDINKKIPPAFNSPYYPACDVHGNFSGSNDNPDFTGAGRNWTWVSNPFENQAKNQGPFKILYTCFEERRVQRGTPGDQFCAAKPPQFFASERDLGVPSGAGWHRIGDRAETLFNSVERVPLLVSAGFSDVTSRVGLTPPSGAIAYGYTDIAVARWLWPGEAFFTARPPHFPAQRNYHWFVFHAPRPVCTLEWVHPCPIQDPLKAQFGCAKEQDMNMAPNCYTP